MVGLLPLASLRTSWLVRWWRHLMARLLLLLLLPLVSVLRASWWVMSCSMRRHCPRRVETVMLTSSWQPGRHYVALSSGQLL